MMTSTFPTSRSNSREIKYGLKDIQNKKQTLTTLEAALKKRMNEFRELCLKEGELTGQLPIDYPLQPREPIPQVRRRITRSHGNIPSGVANGTFAQPLPPPCPPQRTRHHDHIQNPSLPLPLSRPTSTNSSSSSASTASSNTRSLSNHQAPTSNIIPNGINNNNNNNINGHHYHSSSLNMLKLVHSNKDTKIGGGNSVANFQPYYEETKPFQMSDFYKYSSKHRQKVNCDPADLNSSQQELTNMVNNHTKSTRQLQDEILNAKNALKYSSCDDQLQPTVNIFEKSGQKLMEATARAIAGNPALAEKLNNILPNHNYHHNHLHHHHKHHQHLHQKQQQQQQ